jgi:chromosome segregation ATPase
MGITSLSQVRAQALSDFIYKQGTAGVTRASVSIMFDNRNKEQAPDGYKMCKLILYRLFLFFYFFLFFSTS